MKPKWTYGTAGDRWPVKSGDVWQAGPHIICCGDLERGAGLEVVQTYVAGRPAMAYMDPPWNPGNARCFRTKAGDGRPVDFQELLRRIVDALRGICGDLYLEMGFRYHNMLLRVFREAGAVDLRTWEITYYRKHPAFCTLFGWGGKQVAEDLPNLEGVDDEDTPALAILASSRPGDLVVDLCAGRGGTVRAAHQTGRHTVALELNPRRIACAIDWLSKRGCQPDCVGRLASMS